MRFRTTRNAGERPARRRAPGLRAARLRPGGRRRGGRSSPRSRSTRSPTRPSSSPSRTAARRSTPTASRSSSRAARPTTAKRRRARSSRRRTRSSGAASPSSCSSLLMWKFALPGVKEGMNDRTERIRADLDAAETAKTEAGRRARRLQGPAGRRQGRGRPHHRGGPPVGRRAEAGPGGPAPDGAGRGPGPRRRRHRGRQGPGHRRPAGRARRSWPSVPPRAVVNKNLDPAAQTQLIEDYINSVGHAADGRRAEPRLRARLCSRSPAPRATLARGRATSSSASPASSRATTSCAPRSPTSSSR